MNFINIYIAVGWQEFLSETLVVYGSVLPKFVAIRHYGGDLIDAKPEICVSDMDVITPMASLHSNSWDPRTAGVYS